jgi:hypothetical protein
MVEWVFLAGVPVRSDLVLALATLVKDPQLADKLERGVTRDVIVIGLNDDERTAVLKALVNPPHGLEDVRESLLAEQSLRAPADERHAASTAA